MIEYRRSSIMTTIEMRKAFEQMLENIDSRMFLKASPLESGERSKLDKCLSETMYYDLLYANSKKADDLVAEIKQKIIAEDTHNFIFSGYKGCGKSTFVGYLLRHINVRSLVIKFDEHWEPKEGIIQNIVMFIYEKIFEDILPENGKEACRISDKYIEIFNDNMNGDFIEKHIDLHDYFTFFTHKLMYAVRLRKQQNFNREHVKIALRDHVKAHIKSNSISNLMMLLVFWDVAERIVNNESPKCCIVFENLDVIYNTEDVPELVRNVVAFRNNIDKITESIFYNGEIISDPTQDYILVFVMRETTTAEFSSSINHFSDRKIRFQPFMMVSEIYDLYDIILKRYQYLISIKDQFFKNQRFMTMVKTIEDILGILQDSVTRKRIFAIFNNDYRTSIEALCKFNFSDPQFLLGVNRLKKIPINENWPTFGYRSIIYRHIFNQFVKDIYWGMIKKYEYTILDNGRAKSIYLDRMILLYLNNSQNIFVPEKLSEKEYVPLNMLYGEMLKFCKKPEIIVDVIWSMYSLQNSEIWNHFITFDDMHIVTKAELQQEMDSVLQKKEDIRFAKIRITLAGQVYLNYILPHFEYYVTRSQLSESGQLLDYYSIFCLSSEELCNIEKCRLIIKNERREIFMGCQRLYHFFLDELDKIEEFKGQNFLDTRFATIKISENTNRISRMYHCEKVIYSSIGYLESFRSFVFYQMDKVNSVGKFEADVEITSFMGKIANCNKNIQGKLPSEIFIGANKCIVLKYVNNSHILYITKKDGTTKEIDVKLNIIIEMIKICYNKLIVDSIVKLIKMFGFRKGQQITACSQGTSPICSAFDACIIKIASSHYEDFKTTITTKEGEKIQAENNRQLRQMRLEQRQLESEAKQRERLGSDEVIK